MNKEESIKFASNYLSDILTFFNANLLVNSSCDEDVIELSIPSSELNSLLIGRNSETLRSLQYIVSSALRSKEASLYRVNIDIADYKKQRSDKLAKQAVEWIEEVRKTGNSKVLSLNPADRRIVHRVAGDYSDIITSSEGVGRDRKIIIAQSSS